jgi:putative membrane protein
VLRAVLILPLLAGPAQAHGPAIVTPDALHAFWTIDPLVIVPLVVAHWLYGRGVHRLWSEAGRGRGISWLRAASFLAGEAALVAALVSPLDALGGTLLSAHMTQHALLVAVAPPLLLLGLPGAAFAWSLSPGRRRGVAGSAVWRTLVRLGDVLSRPFPAAVLHGAVLWLWHAPALFDAAIVLPWLHAVEHLSFFATAILFWRAVLAARSAHRAASALGAAFATLVHGGLLGALITLAPHPLYASYAGRTEIWGLTALDDQQLAGLLMWVPMGLVYLAACLVLARRVVGGASDAVDAITSAPHRPS